MDILPAILAKDAKDLVQKLRAVEDLVDMVHVDIMDGNFVLARTIQAKDLAAARPKCRVQIHLMAFKPEKYIPQFAGLADEFIFHLEACDNPGTLARTVRKAGLKPGFALNPDTATAEIQRFAKLFDVALVMSVHPGASGQAFIPDVLPKLKELKRSNPKLRVGVDGGIGIGSCCQAAKAGAQFIAAASAIFGKNDLKGAISALQKDASCARKR
jgi:ribulose-phosphate 3-epimerase